MAVQSLRSRAILATLTLAILQGGLPLAKVRRDVGQLRIAADTVLALIRAVLRSARLGHPGRDTAGRGRVRLRWQALARRRRAVLDRGPRAK